jgi:hypothetical protein
MSARPNAKASLPVISEGPVWLWRLADECWPQAQQRLDSSRAVQHLVSVGRALWGEDQEQFQVWIRPLVRQLKNASALTVIRQLAQGRRGCRPGRPPKPWLMQWCL